MFWRYGWLKNPEIWFTEKILVHNSGTKMYQISNLKRNTTNNINFHYRTKSVNINDQYFYEFKKPCFWSIFGPFSQFFWKNIFVKTSSSGLLAPCQNLEEIQCNSKKTTGKTEGRSDWKMDGPQDPSPGIH